MLTASPLTLFVDRKDIRWGEEWKKRIDEALQRTTFFIPLITPNYFRHEHCRSELLRFFGAAKQFGVQQFLLPIYYVEVPELESAETPSDEAMAIVKDTHWVDLRDLRLRNESDSEHRTLVNEPAKRLQGIAERTEDEGPTAESMNQPRFDASAHSDDEDEPKGVLDLLAQGEHALPAWNKTLESFSAELQVFNRLTKEATTEFEAEAASGKATFATRLATANRFAKRIDGTAENIAGLGKDYVTHLVEVDPAVRALIRIAREDEDFRNDPKAGELFGSIRELTTNSRANAGQIETLASTLEQNAGFSRELRRPLKKINGALRNVIDAQVMLDEWGSEIDSLLDSDGDDGVHPSTDE